jgi:predicted nucleic acid-binding protein
VLDASIALSWCFEDESTDYAVDVLHALRRAEAIVPPIWALEVSNVLAVAERRRRLDGSSAERCIGMLLGLPIAMDPGSRNGPFKDVRRLARSHGLSMYDASYLELAARLTLPLATLDEPLQNAAGAAGVARFRPG